MVWFPVAAIRHNNSESLTVGVRVVTGLTAGLRRKSTKVVPLQLLGCMKSFPVAIIHQSTKNRPFMVLPIVIIHKYIAKH